MSETMGPNPRCPTCERDGRGPWPMEPQLVCEHCGHREATPDAPAAPQDAGEVETRLRLSAAWLREAADDPAIGPPQHVDDLMATVDVMLAAADGLASLRAQFAEADRVGQSLHCMVLDVAADHPRTCRCVACAYADALRTALASTPEASDAD